MTIYETINRNDLIKLVPIDININDEKETRIHTRIQYIIATLGSNLKFDFSIASNDKNLLCDGKSFKDIRGYSETKLNTSCDEKIQKIIGFIDEIWSKNSIPKYVWEIEDTTSISSGIARISHLLAANEDTKIIPIIVYPDNRIHEVIKVVENPIYNSIRDNIKFISYSNLEYYINLIKELTSCIEPKEFMKLILDSFETLLITETKEEQHIDSFLKPEEVKEVKTSTTQKIVSKFDRKKFIETKLDEIKSILKDNNLKTHSTPSYGAIYNSRSEMFREGKNKFPPVTIQLQWLDFINETARIAVFNLYKNFEDRKKFNISIGKTIFKELNPNFDNDRTIYQEIDVPFKNITDRVVYLMKIHGDNIHNSMKDVKIV